jgi:aryl-alcohol dehydrogenase-like predicted oxidoreductase
MEHRTLGRSGLQVTPLTLGAMTFGESEGFMKGVTSSDDEARRVLDRALDAGIDTIDTANVYSEGRSEELLGRWLAGKRDRVVLATKCRFAAIGVPGHVPGPFDQGLSRKAIVRACEASLSRLRTDHVDLYQVHMQDRAVPIEETLRALDDLVRAGKVRYVGCSNYAGYRLAEAHFTARERGYSPYVSVQLQWSLIERGAEREVLPACRAFGVGTMIWSPLARGFLSGKYRRDEQPTEGRLASWGDSWRAAATDRGWAILDRVRELAAAHSTTPAAVSLAWLLAKPETSTVVVGARTVAQLEQNLAALEVKLSPADMAALDEVSAPAWGYPYSFIGAREPW